jgi:colanic acid biosynthesis glycosyl transferase WcaI
VRLLLVNQHYPPDSGATGRLLAQLAERLARAGHRVTVLTGRPTYAEARDRSDAPLLENRNGVRVVRLPMLPRRDGALGRSLHYLGFATSMLVAGLRERRPDAVLAWSSTPMFGGPAALAVARFHRAAFVYGVQDVYPEIAVALGALRSRPLVRLARLLERLAWRGADRVVVIGRALAAFAADRGVDPSRVVVIENWADTETLRPCETSGFRTEIGLAPDDFVVQYAGNLGRSQDLEAVLEAARLVEAAGEESGEAEGRRVRFLLVGAGANAPAVEAAAAGAGNVSAAPYQPEERLGDVLAAADLALVPLRSGLGRYCVPSKLYSILASGRPVGALLDSDTDVARIVETAECGFRVDPDDPRSLADEILRLAAEPDRARRFGENGRRWGEEKGSLARAAARYEGLLGEVIAGSRGSR